MGYANVGSVADIIAQIRLEGDLNDDVPTAAELLRSINFGWAHLHDILLDANINYYLNSSTVSVVSGTSEYSLPTDFYLPRMVVVTDSGNSYPLREISLEEMYRRSSPDYLNAKSSTGWLIVDEKLRFMPEPTWSDDVTFYYAQCATDLASSDTDVKVRNRYGYFLVAWVLYQLALTDHMGEAQALQRLKLAKEHIIKMATKRQSNLGTGYVNRKVRLKGF